MLSFFKKILVLFLLVLGLDLKLQVSLGFPSCLLEGQPATFDCRLVTDPSQLLPLVTWTGFGNLCGSPNTLENNTISYAGNCDDTQQGVCDIFTAIPTGECTTTMQISTLSFVANYSYNGLNISCGIAGTNESMIFQLRIGINPDPPVFANISFPNPTLLKYNWRRPTNVIGGVFGYNLTFVGENCGTCNPANEVPSTVFSAACINWEPKGQVCYFEVQTITADCGFTSEPARRNTILDNTQPSNITVFVICGTDVNFPDVLVEWKYLPPDEGKFTTIPGVIGFKLTIFDELNHSHETGLLNDPGLRQYRYSSSVLGEYNLVGNNRMVKVTVETEVGSFSSMSDIFSVQQIITNDEPTLTPRECIEVTINSYCNETADEFEVQLHFVDGFCDNRPLSQRTSTVIFHDYEACVPLVGPESICYSAVVFHDSMNAGRTEPKQLTLIPCNTSQLNVGPRVLFNTTSTGEILHFGELPESHDHNDLLIIRCEQYCATTTVNQTICVNGTFEPSSDIICNCSELWALTFGISLPTLVLVVIVVALATVLACHCACDHRRRQKVTLHRHGDGNYEL